MRRPTSEEMKIAKSKIEMNLPKFRRLARDNMVIFFDSLLLKVRCKDAVANYHMSMTKKFIKYSNKETKDLKQQVKNWKLAYTKLLKKKGKK